jgi:FkbM family methyltransferase
MATTPLHLRSFISGVVGGLVIAAGVGVARWHPSAPSPFESYSQQGEDYVIRDVFEKLLHIEKPSYIDIGAHEPIVNNNTYLFYSHGAKGVLVEPNPDFTDLLKKTRPRDTVLDVGIGALGEEKEVDYYVMWEGHGQLNTFSPENAKEHHVRTTIKRKLVDVNKVLAQYFPEGGPDLFSVDTEGYDLTILQSLDFTRFRPRVVCAETEAPHGEVNKEILDLMASKNYEVRGGTWLNTIFVDRDALAKRNP